MLRAFLLCMSLPCFAVSQRIALTDCTVVDARSGTIRPHQNILLLGERIVSVGPVSSTRIPAGSRTVGCAGRFVIPGLWDMHVHAGEIEENWFPLYVANGVTGLREMAASEANTGRQRQYQVDLARGNRQGPELFTTLFAMDAPAIRSERQARAEVARRAAMGMTYIKVYNGLSRPAYFAIADECRRRGLQLVGQIPAPRAGQPISMENTAGDICQREGGRVDRLVSRGRRVANSDIDAL